eukprot:2803562-Prymnesium_polylepis.2
MPPSALATTYSAALETVCGASRGVRRRSKTPAVVGTFEERHPTAVSARALAGCARAGPTRTLPHTTALATKHDGLPLPTRSVLLVLPTPLRRMSLAAVVRAHLPLGGPHVGSSWLLVRINALPQQRAASVDLDDERLPDRRAARYSTWP